MSIQCQKNVGNDGQNEMVQLLESSIGPMTSLLDKKFLKKVSLVAMKTIMSSVIKLTLETANIDNPDIEKKVFDVCAEKGILPHKEKTGCNGYTLFCKEQREKNKEQFDGKSLGEISKELSQVWKTISTTDKEEYKTRAKNTPVSKKSDKKESGSRKNRNKSGNNKCSFVISKGERKGETCGTSVRSDEPAFEGEWLCSKHATAEKKKVESRKNK